MAGVINDIDMEKAIRLDVVSAPPAHDFHPIYRSSQLWKFEIVQAGEKMEYTIRNPRWACSYSFKRFFETKRNTLETHSFSLKKNGKESFLGGFGDLKSLSNKEDINVSVETLDGKKKTDRLYVYKASRKSKIALFVDTVDGLLLVVPHGAAHWTLTRLPEPAGHKFESKIGKFSIEFPFKNWAESKGKIVETKIGKLEIYSVGRNSEMYGEFWVQYAKVPEKFSGKTKQIIEAMQNVARQKYGPIMGTKYFKDGVLIRIQKGRDTRLERRIRILVVDNRLYQIMSFCPNDFKFERKFFSSLKAK